MKTKSLQKKQKKQIRQTGEHLWAPCGGFPRCVTCGCDEDDAHVGGQECSFKKGDKV